MRYYSLSNPNLTCSFSEAVIQGQAVDGGLFSPQHIPKNFDLSLLNRSILLQEIAVPLLEPMMTPCVSLSRLSQICTETFNFPLPLKRLTDDLWVLELFHGPTAAFKDIGARFLSRILSTISEQQLTIIVATSGDTGGAVAHGFHNIKGLDVVILYPKGRVSSLQEHQLTTLGGNISALEVEGSFDDCQSMAKAMLQDTELRKIRPLTSANSINIARWLPQSVYYAWAAHQLRQQVNCQEKASKDQSPLYIIPSGNLGNLAAGLFAWRRGLQTSGFIAATNRNDSFTRFVDSGDFIPQQSVQTPSNAMDVGNPSNRSRVNTLFDHNHSQLKQHLYSYSISDDSTLRAMKHLYMETGYLLCPHSAVGYEAYQRHRRRYQSNGQPAILLATAHPAKFTEIVTPVIDTPPPMPPSLSHLFRLDIDQRVHKTPLKADPQALKDYLLASMH